MICNSLFPAYSRRWGNAVPYGIAAAVAHPGRQVIRIVGDRGLTMLMGEVATCVKGKLPVKIIVIKNDVLGETKWEQIAMEANPEYGVELQPIDFATFAQSCRSRWFHRHRARPNGLNLETSARTCRTRTRARSS